MKLRNDCADLDDLARSLEVNKDELEQRLAQAGYRYAADLNQFRLK